MKLSRRAFVSTVGAGAAALALAGCGGGEKKEDAPAPAPSDELRFVTGGEAGTYYAFGGVLAQHATNNAGIKVTALVGNGSQANVQEMQDGNAELALCQTDVMTYAYEGSNLFKDTGKVDCFSIVANLYNEQVQIVTCDPNIKTVADLKGKAVSIGAAGSGVYFNAIDILGAYDITEADIKPTYQSFGDSTDALKDGKIDAAFIVAGAPTTAITDLSTSKTAYLVALDKEHVEKLTAGNEFYIADTIKKDTYKGQDADIATVAVGAILLASDALDEETVYKFTADLFAGAEDNAEAHAKYAELDMKKAAGIKGVVPYHAGAAKFYKENNIEVTAK